MSRHLCAVSVGLVIWGLAASSAGAAALKTGDLAPDFTLPEWNTGRPVNLRDFAGRIVLLDFFAYYCPYCQASMRDADAAIQDYYAARGGNPAGLPVQFIAMNIITTNRASTDTLLRDNRIDLALDDGGRTVFQKYSIGYVPHFVVINGAAGGNFRQWEILYSNSGYAAGEYVQLRSLIDRITPEPGMLALVGLAAMFAVRRSF